jgi:type II secretory pathway component PulF
MAISLNNKEKAPRLPVKGQPSSFLKPGPLIKRWSGMILSLGRPIKPREVIFFTSQLSMMLEIGTSPNKALSVLRDQIKNPAFKEVIQAMIRDIEEGRQLSDAMERHPRLFNNVFVSMIRAGETGGFLKEIIDRIVEMQEKRQALIAQVRSAMTYPLVLCILGSLVVVFVLVSVLPKFTTFFEGKENILPFTTRFLMTMSASVRGYWWAYLIGGTGLAVFLKFWKDSEQGQALLDRFCVSAPIVAGLFNKMYTCQLLRTLGHLLESQVPLLEALEVTRATVKNRYFKDLIDRTIANVEQGGKFSQTFAVYPYIMDTVKQMVATGEEAGNLSPVMLRLAKFYDTEVDHQLKSLSSIIEPLGLIVMGAVVALIVSSVILPLFRIGQAIH